MPYHRHPIKSCGDAIASGTRSQSPASPGCRHVQGLLSYFALECDPSTCISTWEECWTLGYCIVAILHSLSIQLFYCALLLSYFLPTSCNSEDCSKDWTAPGECAGDWTVIIRSSIPTFADQCLTSHVPLHGLSCLQTQEPRQ